MPSYPEVVLQQDKSKDIDLTTEEKEQVNKLRETMDDFSVDMKDTTDLQMLVEEEKKDKSAEAQYTKSNIVIFNADAVFDDFFKKPEEFPTPYQQNLKNQ